MTAEVLVMNKTAVALAADSAVTSGGGKIFNSINKLFRLLDHQPVGIMIYGNAEFMGLPWESLIKMYKDRSGTTSKSSVEGYGVDFIDYIKQQHALFPDEEREGCVRRAVFAQLEGLLRIVHKIITLPSKNADSEIKTIVQNYTNWVRKNCRELPSAPGGFRKQLDLRYRTKINESIDEAFAQFSISPTTKSAIRSYCLDCICRENFGNCSDIVIAGFGEAEIFPDVEYEIDGFPLGDFLKYRPKKQHKINFDASASIASFAQMEMVQSFMTGIHPYVKQHLDAYLGTVLNGFEQGIIKSLGSKCNVNLPRFTKKLKKASKTIVESLGKSLESHQHDYHISPVLDAVEMLPKDELAIMAESLVNLTVLKRRMSTDQESVGGPIDVAVISKGDGFVWIKRKHYFTKDLNPRYATQYLFPDQPKNQKSHP